MKRILATSPWLGTSVSGVVMMLPASEAFLENASGERSSVSIEMLGSLGQSRAQVGSRLKDGQEKGRVTYDQDSLCGIYLPLLLPRGAQGSLRLSY